MLIKVAFGRHETFHLRFAWLVKGFAAFQANADLFDDVDAATVTLGVGKNMVQAIRYWMRAAQLIDPCRQSSDCIGRIPFDIEGR